MHHGQHTTITTADIDLALRVLNIEPRHSAHNPLTFRRTLPFRNVSFAGPVYFVKEQEWCFGSGNRHLREQIRRQGRSNGLWSHITRRPTPPSPTHNEDPLLGVHWGRDRPHGRARPGLIGVGREVVIEGLLEGGGTKLIGDECTHAGVSTDELAAFVMMVSWSASRLLHACIQGALQVVHPVHPPTDMSDSLDASDPTDVVTIEALRRVHGYFFVQRVNGDTAWGRAIVKVLVHIKHA